MMQKFQPAEYIPLSDEKIAILTREYKEAHPDMDITEEIVRNKVESEMKDVKIFLNDKYQVQIRETKWGAGLPEDQQTDMIWLSIKRIDRESIHDWRELQQIKNELVGEQNEGFEIYPSEDRLVDTSNQYHIWVFKNPKIQIPVGFFGDRAVSEIYTYGVTKQRPFHQVEVDVPNKIKRRNRKIKNRR